MSEETKNQAIELSDEEIENAVGGKAPPPTAATCPRCKYVYDYKFDETNRIPPCPACRFDRYTQLIPTGEEITCC